LAKNFRNLEDKNEFRSELYPTTEEQRRFDELQKPYAKQMQGEIQALKVKVQEMDKRLNEIERERTQNLVVLNET
jgi:hypothetical protein